MHTDKCTHTMVKVVHTRKNCSGDTLVTVKLAPLPTSMLALWTSARTCVHVTANKAYVQCSLLYVYTAMYSSCSTKKAASHLPSLDTDHTHIHLFCSSFLTKSAVERALLFKRPAVHYINARPRHKQESTGIDSENFIVHALLDNWKQKQLKKTGATSFSNTGKRKAHKNRVSTGSRAAVIHSYGIGCKG